MPSAPSPRPLERLAPEGWTQAAEVVKVTDGDTIDVMIGDQRYTVRYIGIDTPEEFSPDRGREWLADEATEANELLVGGRSVRLERDVSDTDRFDRLLRYVWLETASGWQMANRELVRDGLAEAKAYEPDTKWQQLLDDAEAEAREEQLGMWAGRPGATSGTSPAATPVRFIGENCEPAYPDACIAPPPPDLDCRDVTQRRFTVLPPDPHNFDGDRNGVGCEAP